MPERVHSLLNPGALPAALATVKVLAAEAHRADALGKQQGEPEGPDGRLAMFAEMLAERPSSGKRIRATLFVG